MDYVSRLGAGEISEDEAEAELWALIDSWGGEPDDLDGFASHVQMTRSEYTLRLLGSTLKDIARLRASGWPESCRSCGEVINYDEGFWYHPPDDPKQVGWIGCVACAGHPAQDVVPWEKD
jgi:hypothetical protein